jgi:hypothetical protein
VKPQASENSVGRPREHRAHASAQRRQQRPRRRDCTCPASILRPKPRGQQRWPGNRRACLRRKRSATSAWPAGGARYLNVARLRVLLSARRLHGPGGRADAHAGASGLHDAATSKHGQHQSAPKLCRLQALRKVQSLCMRERCEWRASAGPPTWRARMQLRPRPPAHHHLIKSADAGLNRVRYGQGWFSGHGRRITGGTTSKPAGFGTAQPVRRAVRRAQRVIWRC